MKRIIALVASVFMAASLMLFVSPSTAQASAADKASEGRSLVSSDSVMARRTCLRRVNQPRTRQVNLCGVVKRGKAVFTGRVFPKYKRKPVLLQRKVGKRWKTVKRDRTNLRGKYRFVIKRTGTYRTKARAGRGFRASFSDGTLRYSRY